jgi:hypothetical protein
LWGTCQVHDTVFHSLNFSVAIEHKIRWPMAELGHTSQTQNCSQWNQQCFCTVDLDFYVSAVVNFFHDMVANQKLVLQIQDQMFAATDQ